MPATETRVSATVGGLVALCAWASTIAVSRHLAESIGALRSGTLVFLLAGTLGCVRYLADRRGWQEALALPKAHLGISGGLFAAYIAALYLAIGLAANRRAVLIVGMLNYLWPALTLLLSVPILKRRCTAGVIPGAVLALAGEALVIAGGTGATLPAGGGTRNAVAFMLAAAAAVCWALYSNLTRRLAGQARGDAVPLFMLAAAAVLLPLNILFPAHATWTGRVFVELGFMVVFPGLLAYSCWDRGMRNGNATLLATASYFVPVAATAIGCWYLQVQAGWALWAGCALVVAGACICYRAFTLAGDGQA